MRNAILKTVAFVGFVAAPAASFAAGYGAAGCGLGSIVLGDKPGFMQVFASTTNGTAGSQTFGITSGTSNCAEGGKASLMQETFVAMNSANLSRDAAVGGGQYLTAFSVIVGCEAGAQADFYNVAKTNHDRIFTANAEAPEILSNFRTVLAENNLGTSCKL